MRRLLALPWLAVLVFLAGVAAGQLSFEPRGTGSWGFFRGNEFKDLDERMQMYYVMGVHDAFWALTIERNSLFLSLDANTQTIDTEIAANDIALSRMIGTLSQIPSGVTAGQMLEVLNRYLEQNPSERHNNAALLFWRAVAKANWN